MNKRGLVILIVGFVMVGTSLVIATSIIPSGIDGPNDMSMPSLFEGMFNEISHEIQIMPGDSAYLSYSTLSSNVPLLWGVQIIDYQANDKLSIKISNIFGDEYGEFIQEQPILFELLEITQSDTLNFEIQNLGDRNVEAIMMFSEDPENSDAFSNTNSVAMNLILPLAISGVLLILGIIISIIGVIVLLVDLKNYQNDKRNY